MLFVSLCLSGCSSPLWEVTVFNNTDQPISLKSGKRNGKVQPGGRFSNWALKKGQTLQLLSPEKKVLKELQPSELGLSEEKDGAALLVHGQPSNFVLADYSEFYVAEGEEAPKNPQIKLVANLRDKEVVLIDRGDLIAWPNQGLAETRYDGGGFKNRRFLRVIPLPPEVSDDQVTEFLEAELLQQTSK